MRSQAASAHSSGQKIADHGQLKVRMTPINTKFVNYFLGLKNIENHCNPLIGYGEATDERDNFINFVLSTANFRTPNTYISEDNPNIKLMSQDNNYKSQIDPFLRDYYPEKLGRDTIDRSPELILRTIRSFILNIEHYLDGEEKKEHLEVAKTVCVYIMDEDEQWAEDRGLLDRVFSDNKNHYREFFHVIETLIDMLDTEIKEQSQTLEANKLLTALKDLKKDQEYLSKNFPMILLLRLLDRPIPENFLSDDIMKTVFENEDLTLAGFNDSSISPGLKQVIDNDDDIFKLVKYIFSGETLKRLRKEPYSGGNEEEATVLDEKTAEEPTTRRNASTDTQLIIRSFPPAREKAAIEYHPKSASYAKNRDLIVAVLPAPLRKIYKNKEVYSKRLVTQVVDHVENLLKGFYLIEQLIHLSKNIDRSITFHQQGGNILSKKHLPLLEMHDSAVAIFEYIKTVSEELKKLSRYLRTTRADIYRNINLLNNSKQARVLTEKMVDRINNSSSIKALKDSLESLNNDISIAWESLTDMTMPQTALEGLPLRRLSSSLTPFTSAMVEQYEHQGYGQPMITSDEESDDEALVLEEAKDWHATHPSLDSEKDFFNLQTRKAEAEERIEAYKNERDAHQRALTHTQATMLLLNRDTDLSAKLCQWWVPLTLVGIPAFIGARLYRWWNQESIKADRAKHKECQEEQETISARIQVLDSMLEKQFRVLLKLNKEILELQRSNQARANNTPARVSGPHSMFPNPTNQSQVKIREILEDKSDKETAIKIATEAEACAEALLSRLSEDEVKRLYKCQVSELGQALVLLLPKDSKHLTTLMDEQQQETICNLVITELLTPERFQTEKNMLLATASSHWHEKLRELEEESLLIALNASINTALPEINNEWIKKYIIQTLVVPALQTQKEETIPSPKPF